VDTVGFVLFGFSSFLRLVSFSPISFRFHFYTFYDCWVWVLSRRRQSIPDFGSFILLVSLVPGDRSFSV